MVLPLLGFFLLGIPLLGGMVAGYLNNSFWANGISIASFVPSFFLHLIFLILTIHDNNETTVLQYLIGLGMTIGIPLAAHFGIRYLVRYVRIRLSTPHSADIDTP